MVFRQVSWPSISLSRIQQRKQNPFSKRKYSGQEKTEAAQKGSILLKESKFMTELDLELRLLNSPSTAFPTIPCEVL